MQCIGRRRFRFVFSPSLLLGVLVTFWLPVVAHDTDGESLDFAPSDVNANVPERHLVASNSTAPPASNSTAPPPPTDNSANISSTNATNATTTPEPTLSTTLGTGTNVTIVTNGTNDTNATILNNPANINNTLLLLLGIALVGCCAFCAALFACAILHKPGETKKRGGKQTYKKLPKFDTAGDEVYQPETWAGTQPQNNTRDVTLPLKPTGPGLAPPTLLQHHPVQPSMNMQPTMQPLPQTYIPHLSPRYVMPTYTITSPAAVRLASPPRPFAPVQTTSYFPTPTSPMGPSTYIQYP